MHRPKLGKVKRRILTLGQYTVSTLLKIKIR